MLIVAPLQSPVGPALIRDFLVTHLPAENPAEGRDDVPQSQHFADHRVGAAGRNRIGSQHPGGDAGDVLARYQWNGCFLASPRQIDCCVLRHAGGGQGADILVENGGPDVRRTDPGPLEDLLGKIILPHPGRRGVRRRDQHHHIDEARDTRLARRGSHDCGRLEQPGLDRVSEIDGRNPPHRALDGMVVKEIAFNYLGAQSAQLIGAFIDLVDEGAHRHPAREQQFGNVPAGFALRPSGCACDEYWICHGWLLGLNLENSISIWYRVVSSI